MIDVDIKFPVNNTKEVMQALEDKKDVILEVIGGMVEGYAKELAPVGTPESTGIPGYLGGSLRDSIRHETEGNATLIKAGGIESTYRFVDYAVYVELGTARMNPKPYLRPAVENHMDEYKNVIDTELGN